MQSNTSIFKLAVGFCQLLPLYHYVHGVVVGAGKYDYLQLSTTNEKNPNRMPFLSFFFFKVQPEKTNTKFFALRKKNIVTFQSVFFVVFPSVIIICHDDAQIISPSATSFLFKMIHERRTSFSLLDTIPVYLFAIPYFQEKC